MSDLSTQAVQAGNTPGTAKKIVVIGGGFAGVNFAQGVAKNKNYQVTLVDKNNYNYFPPLLYQVSTSFLEPSSISYPFRKLFRKDNIRFRMGEPVKIDPDKQTVYLKDGELSYDYLVFASGAKTNFFGNQNIEKNAIPMKSIDDGLRMRNAMLETVERATITQDPAERKKLLTVVVAGGGPTGVEVSGMLAEMKKYIFKKDYPELINQPGAIYIIDGSPNLLGAMSEKTHQEAYKVLTALGVKVKLNLHVNDYVDGRIMLSNGEVIESNTLIWAAGIIANTFEGIPATSLGAGKRMITNEHNKVIGVDNIYAIGDASIQTTDEAYPKGHPQIAQVAIQQGKTLAANFIAIAKGQQLKTFKYFDKGDMAIIGRNNAVVDLFKHKVHFSGIIALFMWLFIHLISLVNYRNKLRTLYNWAVSYISRDQSFRMIFKSGI
ncbi:NAD(P)/FAD-dependent oxidoreductase [Mucilaginibacter phyllosphaerae]|uniref:NADH:ubiquinone reductase (non-electrogenic) n=1 Tax=Mucilaginibacter phyllosphaerae TaxID=1812349 RepID=A0A4Y8ACN6_9SPHI|nr:NAD(P)/FAD-dependent oxidoreductase [Mucilaginibacter phyllosphaerae]MBB3969422.1 NADH dehydrogenase [Mucilaginibacter phyllosphaerae]TEW65792.1 NAD(P)/FAD-dependent oxidoreductase [Mucilaginibacter phyllosphaerae]GGH08419.1 NADH dehydrogenase [Mucilaginibacter phyllosphaerae]